MSVTAPLNDTPGARALLLETASAIMREGDIVGHRPSSARIAARCSSRAGALGRVAGSA